ncbi:MAG: hypothetical protein ACRYFV_03140 [Janthinobacterium lividum]
MKNLTLSLGRVAVVLAGALSLGACSRSEYAFLPHSASYLGSTPVARQRAVAAPVTATQATPAIAATGSAVVTAPATPSVALEALAAAPVAATPAPATTAPVAAATVATPEASVAVAPAAKPAAAPKLNLAQRLAMHKLTKKLDKLTSQAPQFKKKDATASTARISGNLRTGIILLLVGLIVGLFSGFIGTIIALIGVVFLVLWLLDEL